MAAVDTNLTEIRQADLPATANGLGVNGANLINHRTLGISEITRFSQESTTGAPPRISNLRQNQRTKVLSVTSGVGYSNPLTIDTVDSILQELFFAQIRNREGWRVPVSSVDATDGYTIAAASAEQAALFGVNSLVWGRDFGQSANNGLHMVTSAVSENDTEVEADALADEAANTGQNPPPVGHISFTGSRILGPTTKSWAYDSTNERATLTVANANNLPGLYEGQMVVIGSIDSAGAPTNQNAFAGAAGASIFGRARVRSIGTGSITFDRLSANLEASSSGTQGVIDLCYSLFVTNVANDSPLTVRGTRTYEQTLPDFSAVGTPAYRYSDGNLINTATLNMPSAQFATVNVETIGTQTLIPVTTRRDNFDGAPDPALVDSFTGGGDLVRITFEGDTQGYEIDVFDMTWTLSNNLTGTNALTHLGAFRVNTGNFTASMTATATLSSSALEAVMRDNVPISIATVFANSDGVIIPHIPSMTIARTGETYTNNELVRLESTATAFQDPTFNTSCSFSILPIPFVRAQI